MQALLPEDAHGSPPLLPWLPAQLPTAAQPPPAASPAARGGPVPGTKAALAAPGSRRLRMLRGDALRERGGGGR